MAPRPSSPRLRDLDPERFAAGVRDAVAHHVWRLLMALDGIGATEPLEATRSTNGVWLAAHQLATYALTGRGCEDAGGPMEYVQSVAEALYTRAGDQGTYSVPDLDDDADPATWPGLVIRAALARERVMRGIEQVTRADLAVLGSLDDRQVRRLIDEGEIPGDNRRGVHPDHARQWLAVRGVEGFARRPRTVAGTYGVVGSVPIPTRTVGIDRHDGPSCSHTWPSPSPSHEPCPNCGIVEADGPPPST